MGGIIFGQVSGRSRLPEDGAGLPLVIAIHGGSYSSAYFDVPGYSLLDRAEANGIPILAIDRPAYGDTPALPVEQSGIEGQARHLVERLGEAWTLYGAGRAGIVLIGHSIGGAIALTMASAPGTLPIIGVAVSGVGLHTPPDHGPMWRALPDLVLVDMPIAVKDQVMFGPPGSFDAATMPAASHIANTLVPKAELLDITGGWQDRVRDVLGAIGVPVHYRQAEQDALWIVDQSEVDGFAAACSASPRVDAAMVRATGHCMDFHHVSAAFHIQQLGFALQCAVEAA